MTMVLSTSSMPHAMKAPSWEKRMMPMPFLRKGATRLTTGFMATLSQTQIMGCSPTSQVTERCSQVSMQRMSSWFCVTKVCVLVCGSSLMATWAMW